MVYRTKQKQKQALNDEIKVYESVYGLETTIRKLQLTINRLKNERDQARVDNIFHKNNSLRGG